MKKLFLTIIAIYFLAFGFVTKETPVMEVVYTIEAVYIDPLDSAWIALGSLSVSETLRKRNLGHQPKDRV